jgi:hypothetical protein
LTIEVIFDEDHDLSKVLIQVEDNNFNDINMQTGNFFTIDNSGEDFVAIVNFTGNSYDNLNLQKGADSDNIPYMIEVNGTKSMEFFSSNEEVTNSELHTFASVSGLQFAIFKYDTFENIENPGICERTEDNDSGQGII